jgi:hypothetical protein
MDVEMQSSREVRQITITVNKNATGIGKTKYLFGNKNRICGPSYGGTIGTLLLIFIPTLVYAIIM